jgi:hypothetical protein
MGNDFEGILFDGANEEDEPEMTIVEAAQLRLELEVDILDLLRDFEAATELSVLNVSFDGESVVVIAIL